MYWLVALQGRVFKQNLLAFFFFFSGEMHSVTHRFYYDLILHFQGSNSTIVMKL